MDAIIEKYLDAHDRNPELALRAVVEKFGIAKFNQSAGYMRYGVQAEKNPIEIVDNSLPDPTEYTPDER